MMSWDSKIPVRYIRIKNETIKFLNSSFFSIFEENIDSYSEQFEKIIETTIDRELKTDKKIASRLKRNDKENLITDINGWIKNCNEHLNEIENSENDLKSSKKDELLIEYAETVFTLFTHKHRLDTLTKKPKKLYDENNPIINYEGFYWAFDSYLQNVSNAIGRLEIVRKETDKLLDYDISGKAHRGRRELEKQILIEEKTGLKRKVRKEIIELNTLSRKIISDNKLSHADKIGDYIDFISVCQEVFDMYDWYNEKIGEIEENNEIVFISKGKKQMSSWDFLHKTGLYDRFKEKGFTFNPTHSCQLLIEERTKNFETKKNDFLESRRIDKVETNESDISIFYLLWLNNEVKVIDQWLSDKYPNGDKKLLRSNSEIVELIKYKSHIENEINNANSIISGKTTFKQFEKKSSDNSKTRLLIEDAFTSLNNGWKYAFNSEDDYNIFANILTKFFQYEDYELPKEVIKLKRNTKTQMGKVLGQIHKDLSEKSLMSDINYMEIVKVLSPFENDNNVYKALTR